MPDKKDVQGKVHYFAECEIEVHRADGTIEDLGVVAIHEVREDDLPPEWLRAIGAIP